MHKPLMQGEGNEVVLAVKRQARVAHADVQTRVEAQIL